jgi:hypothetical protein
MGFVLWWVFFFNTFIELIKFYICKNLVIIFKLSTIEIFYYKERDFATILVFLGSCYNPRKIAKKEEKIYK